MPDLLAQTLAWQCEDAGMHTPSLPPWADAQLSADLPELCAKGEGQSLEFKSNLPAQGHDISKSIAAFASSNDGLLIYGIADNGEIVGLAEASDQKVRDRIEQRIQNAAREVKPPVHLLPAWAIHEGKIACIVKVEKGFEAIYYATQRPIIRRGPTSRPAEPGEVEQAFRQRYASGASSISVPSTRLIGQRMHRVLEMMNTNRHEPVTVVDLARAMGLSAPAELDAIFAGHQAPTFSILDQFCARFAIDKDWLATGRGHPYTSPVEHRLLPADYLNLIGEEAPDRVYLVRSNSTTGETFILLQKDELKIFRLPDVWHVSDRIGGGGSRQLLSLYDLFCGWLGRGRKDSPDYQLLGRLIDPKLAEALLDGEAYPGIVEKMPLSHWWDDLTDLSHQWTTREGSLKAYGKSFIAAQDLLRTMVDQRLG